MSSVNLPSQLLPWFHCHQMCWDLYSFCFEEGNRRMMDWKDQTQTSIPTYFLKCLFTQHFTSSSSQSDKTLARTLVSHCHCVWICVCKHECVSTKDGKTQRNPMCSSYCWHTVPFTPLTIHWAIIFSAYLNREKHSHWALSNGGDRWSKDNLEEDLKNWIIHIDKVLAINTFRRHDNENLTSLRGGSEDEHLHMMKKAWQVCGMTDMQPLVYFQIIIGLLQRAGALSRDAAIQNSRTDRLRTPSATISAHFSTCPEAPGPAEVMYSWVIGLTLTLTHF